MTEKKYKGFYQLLYEVFEDDDLVQKFYDNFNSATYLMPKNLYSLDYVIEQYNSSVDNINRENFSRKYGYTYGHIARKAAEINSKTYNS